MAEINGSAGRDQVCQTSGADQCLINADFMENKAFVIRFTHRMNSGCGFQTERDYLKLDSMIIIFPLLDLQQFVSRDLAMRPITDVQNIQRTQTNRLVGLEVQKTSLARFVSCQHNILIENRYLYQVMKIPVGTDD